MIRDIITQIELLFNRANIAYDEIIEWGELNPAVYTDFEKVKTIDSFIFRFIKIQDQIGNRLFKSFLNGLGDYMDSMSLLDVLDKLEKLEIIDSSFEWMENRKLRNTLTHEYPDNEAEIIEGIIRALDAYNEMAKVFQKIKKITIKRNLI
ncbi:MAG: hypothetical protein PQJ59_15275 [Spirochaetales bacterium]|nr:hypothetical protein [Spirochaetales bacterium]